MLPCDITPIAVRYMLWFSPRFIIIIYAAPPRDDMRDECLSKRYDISLLLWYDKRCHDIIFRYYNSAFSLLWYIASAAAAAPRYAKILPPLREKEAKEHSSAEAPLFGRSRYFTLFISLILLLLWYPATALPYARVIGAWCRYFSCRWYSDFDMKRYGRERTPFPSVFSARYRLLFCFSWYYYEIYDKDMI